MTIAIKAHEASRGGTGPTDDYDEDGLPNYVENVNGNGTWDPPLERYDAWNKLTSGAPAGVDNDEEWKNDYDHRDVCAAAYYAQDWAFPGKNSRSPW